MGFFSKSTKHNEHNTSSLKWTQLQTIEQLELIKNNSFNNPVVIFKHSTRCSISSMALSRLERNWNPAQTGNLEMYFLDLISYRSVSNAIAEKFSVTHESPQLLLIKNGEVIYHASHNEIIFEDFVAKLV
jgi:bacillithiol system protein YtxJ